MGQFLCLARISFIVLLVLSLASAEAEADDAFQLERSRNRRCRRDNRIHGILIALAYARK